MWTECTLVGEAWALIVFKFKVLNHKDYNRTSKIGLVSDDDSAMASEREGQDFRTQEFYQCDY